MTVDVAPRPRRRAARASAAPAPPEPTIAPVSTIAIGELEQTVFDCPSCSRPLALGERRCPGCRTRLINGVTLTKASTFVTLGLAIGLLAGAGGGVLLGLGRAIGPAAAAPAGAPGAVALTGSNASIQPSASAQPTATVSALPTSTPDPAIPPVTRSALVQVVATNGRLSVSGAGLRAALAARAFDASAVAQIFRSVSADSVFGQQLADRVAGWPASGVLGAQLGSYYGAIHDTAAAGLDASVRNVAAYRAAATKVLRLLDGMAAIDDAVRAAASSAGFALPGPSSAPTAP